MQLPNFSFEKSLIPSTTRFLLGIDEVSRGPLAGPDTIGAFLLDLKNFSPNEFIKLKVRDSKKLSEIQRENIHKYFLQNNYSFKTFSASSQEIDGRGIATCIYELISKALKFYSSSFDFCLIDGNYRLPITNYRSQIKGDSLCFSIASASIVAKIDRDTQMEKYDTDFPQYGFKFHKGYGTKLHLDAIAQHGPTAIHRLSFAPFNKN